MVHKVWIRSGKGLGVNSGVEWNGHIPENWELVQTKRHFQNIKRVVGKAVDEYERLALTMQCVIKRSKE